MSKLTMIKSKVASLSSTGSVSSVTKRETGRALQRSRERIMVRDDYLCQHCLPDRVTLGVEVDHVIPLHLGGADTDRNKQLLCVECHRVKSAEEERGRC